MIAVGLCVVLDAAMLGLGVALGVAVGLANNRFLEWSIRKILDGTASKSKVVVVLSYYLRLTVLVVILFLLYPYTGFAFMIGFLLGTAGLKLLFTVKQMIRYRQSQFR